MSKARIGKATELDLHGEKIGAEEAVALAKELKSNTTLTSLDVRGNSLGSKGGAALADALIAQFADMKAATEQLERRAARADALEARVLRLETE